MSNYTQSEREQAARVLENIWIRYISTFDDIESEEVDALDTAIATLREQGWVKTTERLPNILDADDEGKVPILTRGKLTGSWVRITIFYKAVTTDTAEYFLPLPRAPED
jgi:hypothetical protein